MVSYYKMEDENDYFGSNNLTKVNTPTFVSGKVGNAANFVGGSVQEWKILCWIK